MTRLYSYDLNEIIDFIGHNTKITLNNEKEIEGYLYTIDPETKNVVVYEKKECEIKVVMSHCIKNITILSENIKDIDSICGYNQVNEYTSEWIKERKEALIGHFEKNRVPIEYNTNEPVIYVLGCARVESPYLATSVICDNALIRKRVRDLILEF